MARGYKGIKFDPLTKEEIKKKLEEAKEEMEAVFEWEKEEKERLKNPKTPQAKSAAKRALKKVARRINTVKGNILYWELRVKGKSHFYANLERNELWAELSGKK